MSISEIAINVFVTMIFGWGIMWTLLAWGFGITNFKATYGGLPAMIGGFLWYVLIVCHVIAMYLLWTTSIPALQLIGSLIAFHILFGAIFGQNVSTR